MSYRTAAILLAIALCVMPTFAGATHETEEDCEMEEPPGEVTQINNTEEEPIAYVNDRGPGAIYIYLETNTIDGLQTGGANPTQKALGLGYTDAGHQNICGHPPDYLVF